MNMTYITRVLREKQAFIKLTRDRKNKFTRHTSWSDSVTVQCGLIWHHCTTRGQFFYTVSVENEHHTVDGFFLPLSTEISVLFLKSFHCCFDCFQSFPLTRFVCLPNAEATRGKLEITSSYVLYTSFLIASDILHETLPILRPTLQSKVIQFNTPCLVFCEVSRGREGRRMTLPTLSTWPAHISKCRLRLLQAVLL
jgi:hypothetical protein